MRGVTSHIGQSLSQLALTVPFTQGSLFLVALGRANLSLPPGGRGTAAGFPETNEMSFGGSRVGGGRSLRDFGVLISFIVTHSPSVAYGARADCQASATPKNASKGERHPKHFLGLRLIDKTIFCKISLSKE